jgi:hypothetical protein
MDQVVLLAKLRALVEKLPFFGDPPASSPLLRQWLGQGHALLKQHDPMAAAQFAKVGDLLGVPQTRQTNVCQLVNILSWAVADLEMAIQPKKDQVFGPGAVYDFYRALRDIIISARTAVFIVDPYLDEEIFDTYLSCIRAPTPVRILLRRYAQQVVPAVQKFVSQTGNTVEIRASDKLHDRVVFIDGSSCWVLGQSIKDAAKKGPTYRAPLDPEASALKKENYDAIWQGAKVLYAPQPSAAGDVATAVPPS